jgi:hypothetical protein
MPQTGPSATGTARDLSRTTRSVGSRELCQLRTRADPRGDGRDQNEYPGEPQVVVIRNGGWRLHRGGLAVRSGRVLDQRDTAAGWGVGADGRVPVGIVYPGAGGDEGAG